MGYEFLGHTPQQIAQGIDVNRNRPYERRVLSVKWVSPEQLPVVFHTTNTDGINQVSPAFCQSYDYNLSGKTIPVTYVLPWPHPNRVKDTSEIWGPVKKEAFETTGLPYTYLIAKINNMNFGQIRMGSTMLDKYLLACVNSGFVFKVIASEVENGTTKKTWQEFISLLDLPVIDSHKFRSPSPTLFGAGGLETHLPFDIVRPEFVGYQRLGEYLDVLRDPGQRIRITNVANELAETNPASVMHTIFAQLVDINRKALLGLNKEKRLFISIAPSRKK